MSRHPPSPLGGDRSFRLKLYRDKKRLRITNYRTEHGAQVEFGCELDGDIWAIEAKASKNVGRDDFSGLRSFADFYKKPHRAVVAYMGQHAKKIDGIDVLPWQGMLRAMGL